jgi:hypothetical protein
MKNKKATVQEELSTEQEMNNEVIRVFDQLTEAAMAVVNGFENKKYLTSVMIDHMQYSNNSLVREFLSYFFNITMTRSKSSLLVIYIGFDTEAVARFGNSLHNIFLREVMRLTMKELTTVNIERCIRIDATTKDTRNFYYKRIAEGENEYTTIKTEEPIPA